MSSRKLYKYYSFDEKGYWKCPLQENYLHFSTYKALNDPYELYFRLNTSGELATKLDYLKKSNPESEYVANLLTEEDVQRYLSELNLDYGYHNMSRFFDNIGISCFSKSNDILLMWSHYARGHSGFCLEYDMDQLSSCATSEDKLNWVDVEYVNRVPEISIFSSPTYDQYLKYKYQGWSYEQEVRAFRLPSRYYFKPESITGCVVGLKSINGEDHSTEFANLGQLKSIISTHAPHLKDCLGVAQKHDDKFEVKINPVDFNWLR